MEDRGQGAGVAAEMVFCRTPAYVRNVTEARIGNLLFYWAALLFTWKLGGGRSDPWVAGLATAAVATVPPIVAHSGFATTDVAFVATFLLVLIALRHSLTHSSIEAFALLGVGIGLAVATKFSALVFLPPAAAAIAACHWWERRPCWMALLGSSSFWRALAVGCITDVGSAGGAKETSGLSSVGPPDVTSNSHVPRNCSTHDVPPYSRYTEAPRTSR